MPMKDACPSFAERQSWSRRRKGRSNTVCTYVRCLERSPDLLTSRITVKLHPVYLLTLISYALACFKSRQRLASHHTVLRVVDTRLLKDETESSC